MKRNTLLNSSLKLILSASLVLLGGCAGEDINSESTSMSGEGGIIGTAKVVVKSDSKVEAKSESGEKFNAPINSGGNYKITSTAEETLLLRTKKTTNDKRLSKDTESATANTNYLYSIAHNNGTELITRNVHPFTDLIVRNWFASNTLDINSAFDNNQPIPSFPSLSDINAIEAEVEGIVSKVLADYGVDQSIDLIATPFEMNGEGFDSFLDNNQVVINSENKITVIVKQASGNVINVSVNLLDLASNLTSNNDSPPTTPSNLLAYPHSASSIILRWKTSSDDKGVAGYHIYRDGHNIATTAYPVYTDTGLNISQTYRYQVQAIDGRNQLSTKSDQSSPVMPSASASIPLDGSYGVVVTSTSTQSYCSGATGSFTLTNEEDITGSITSDTNSYYVFALSGKRDVNTSTIYGGLAVTSGQSAGIQYATIDGVIDSISSNGTYSDIRGCTGVWVATKQ